MIFSRFVPRNGTFASGPFRWILHLFMVIALLSLSAGCQRPVAPPGPVTVTERGFDLAGETVFAAKALRTVYDLSTITDTLYLDSTALDSLALPIEQWVPTEINSLVAQSLAKKSATGSAPASGPASGMYSVMNATVAEHSVPRRMSVPHVIDSVMKDSLLAIDDSLFRVRFERNADSIGLWDSAYDILAGHWVFNPTSASYTASVDSLYRYRFADTLSLQVTDAETWAVDEDALVLTAKEQAHIDGIDTVYRHFAQLGNDPDDISETFVLDRASNRSHVTVSRTDQSDQWWYRPDSSVMSEYRDSMVTGQGEWNRLSLSGGVYYFTRSDTAQDIEMTHFWEYASGDLDHQEMVYRQEIKPGGGSAALTAYRRTDKLSNGGTAEYELRNVWKESTLPGSLLVAVTLPPNKRLPNRFGYQDSSFLVLELIDSVGAGQMRYSKLLRREYYQSLGEERTELDYVEWVYTPDTTGGKPAPEIGAISSRPPGTTIVTALYATAPRTLARQWRYVNTGPVDSMAYIWAGVNRDSVRSYMTRNPSTGDMRFAVDRPYGYYRRGSVTTGNTESAIADTLWLRLSSPSGSTSPWDGLADDKLVRIASGALDSLNRGTLQVTGIDTFTLKITDDSVRVECAGQWNCPTGTGLAFADHDSTYVAVAGHSTFEHEVFTYDISVSDLGVMTGTVTGRDTVSDQVSYTADALVINPSYRGSAVLGGIFSNEDIESLTADLEIRLWSTNTVSDVYSFR